MLKLVLILVVLGVMQSTTASIDCSTPDVCKTITCKPVEPCDGRIFPDADTCNCCNICVKTTGQIGVGVGMKCGPPTYLSCDSYLECWNGICRYPLNSTDSAPMQEHEVVPTTTQV